MDAVQIYMIIVIAGIILGAKINVPGNATGIIIGRLIRVAIILPVIGRIFNWW